MTESGISGIVTGFPSLERLLLSNCYGIGDETAELIACYYTQLTHFGAAYTNISDSGVNALTNALHHLVWVDLSFCSGVTAKGIQLLQTSQPCLLELHARHLQIGGTYLDSSGSV